MVFIFRLKQWDGSGVTQALLGTPEPSPCFTPVSRRVYSDFIQEKLSHFVHHLIGFILG